MTVSLSEIQKGTDVHKKSCSQENKYQAVYLQTTLLCFTFSPQTHTYTSGL